LIFAQLPELFVVLLMAPHSAAIGREKFIFIGSPSSNNLLIRFRAKLLTVWSEFTPIFPQYSIKVWSSSLSIGFMPVGFPLGIASSVLYLSSALFDF